jgi:hypothetical protein
MNEIVRAKELKKANQIISPRVARGGSLSLLTRKVFNVLLYHMQRLGEPGLNAPEGSEAYKTLYWLPLHELAKDSAFNSDDAGLIKETLLKLQDIKIITDDSKVFSSDVLVASVKVVAGERRALTMVGWGMHTATEAILRSPEFYTRLSLFYLTSLRTTAGVALYENCKRYATNPSAVSRREPWEWWYEVLTGSPITQEKPEFKYFKRDVLKPAIAEVNTTDIKVELIEHKAGRRVVELQFRIERQTQAMLDLPSEPIIDTTLLTRITNFGVHSREAEDLYSEYDELLLRRTLDLVEARLRDSKLPNLSSPAAYLRSALKGRYADALPVKVVTPKLTPVAKYPEAASEDVVASEARKVALAAYDALPPEDQVIRFAAFLDDNPALRSHARKSMHARLVREALATWLYVQ